MRENEDLQKQINLLAKKYKNKKIAIYGAGNFANRIFANCDISKLNIVAIADKKFNDESLKYFYGLNCIIPEELALIDCDIILIANKDFYYFQTIVESIISNSKNKKVPIQSFIKYKKSSNKFWYFFYKLFNPHLLAEDFVKTLINLSTFYILDKNKRKKKRNYYRLKYSTALYGQQVLTTAKSIGKNFYCGGFSSVNCNTVLKNNVCFNGMKILGLGNVNIGRHFHSGTECIILTSNHNYDKGNAIPYDYEIVSKDVEIGDFVWLGTRVTILPGAKIGEGAIIQAGSVVHGEIPPYAIAGGNPAKVFKYRNIEHFEKLKAEGKFL